MKKLFAVLAAMIAAGMLSVNAQSFWIGPEAGFSASWITHTTLDPGDKVLPHNNFYAGLYAAYDLSDEFMLQAELIYAGKGHSDRNQITDVKYVRDLSYIQLPVFFGYKVNDEKLHILVGPEFGYLVNSTTKRGDVKNDATDDCNRFNIALGVQLAYFFIPQLGIDVKFDFGLNRTFRSGFTYDGPFQDNGHNMSVQLGLVYRFEL